MLRPRGRSPALASLNKALGREVRNVCSVRGWGAGYVELCGSWLCFKTIPHWSHRQQLLVAKRKRESWNAFLPLFSAVQRCRASLLISPSHYFWTELPSSPCQMQKKKKTCFRCKAKLPIQMQKKQQWKKQRPLPVYPPRFRRLPAQFTAICCSYVDLRDAHMDPKCKYLTCASEH